MIKGHTHCSAWWATVRVLYLCQGLVFPCCFMLFVRVRTVFTRHFQPNLTDCSSLAQAKIDVDLLQDNNFTPPFWFVRTQRRMGRFISSPLDRCYPGSGNKTVHCSGQFCFEYKYIFSDINTQEFYFPYKA